MTSKNILDWVTLNYTFEIEYWNKDQILKIFPHLEIYFTDLKKYSLEDIRIYCWA